MTLSIIDSRNKICRPIGAMVVTLQKTKAYPVGCAFNIELFGDINENLMKNEGLFD